MGTKAAFAAMFDAREELAVCAGSERGMNGRRSTHYSRKIKPVSF
jgi:hypothetical protein